MKTLELFSGTCSFSKVAKERGHETFTVDIEPKFKPDLCKDILEVQTSDLPKDIGIMWCSPPCTTFSVASLRHYWTDGKPKNAKTWHGISIVLKTLRLIEEIKPKYWFIENPRGMLRKQWFMQDWFKDTITYCQYGDFRQKPTDIWHNMFKWIPRPPCKPGALCHQSAKRGSQRGTQYIKACKNRSKIPPDLFKEIFDFIENGKKH